MFASTTKRNCIAAFLTLFIVFLISGAVLIYNISGHTLLISGCLGTLCLIGLFACLMVVGKNKFRGNAVSQCD
ncbi:hypothetical protein [Maridesulfovibrio sp.]|uniref:hypothetical protein n=1 Tax=unclassified Maridesulfovibrio TaxID=2794999 RepID=UPI003B00617B